MNVRGIIPQTLSPHTCLRMWTDNVRTQRYVGYSVVTPFVCILFHSIYMTSFLQKVNFGSKTSFLQCAGACTFCLPHLFQSNWIMSTIVDVVDSMLGTVVVAEGLSILDLNDFHSRQQRVTLGVDPEFPWEPCGYGSSLGGSLCNTSKT